MTFLNLLSFIVVLGIIILVHEWGHFYFAKKAGILCHEFSIGMGPVLWQTQKGETTYSIRAIPIGGYVLMAGEEAASLIKKGQRIKIEAQNNLVTKIIVDLKNKEFINEPSYEVMDFDLYGKDQEKFIILKDEESITYSIADVSYYVLPNNEIQIAGYERSIESKTLWQRFMAIFAGPMMNIVLALVVFFILGLLVGRPDLDSTRLGGVLDNSPASSIGLQEGAIITSINGVSISNWDELSTQLDESNLLLPIEYELNGQLVQTELRPRIIFYNAGFSSDFTSEKLLLAGISEQTLAGQAGLVNGDELTQVNNQNVYSWNDVVSLFEANITGQSMTLTVTRNGAEQEISITPYEEAVVTSQGVPLVATQIGINPDTVFDPVYAVQTAFLGTIGSVTSIVDTVRLIATSEQVGVSDLAGPVGIYSLTSQALSQGAQSLLSWMGLLSVNVAVINLLPIPALDGGRLVFLGVEAITKRSVNRELESKIHTAMFFMLLAFFAFVTWNDILRLLG
jgi:regulator of sigma E protease